MTPNDKPSKETLEKWHKDPKNWICGIFYFNKEDKRILPPKRIAWMGWTVNFANSTSVAIFVLFLIAVIGVLIFAPNK